MLRIYLYPQKLTNNTTIPIPIPPINEPASNDDDDVDFDFLVVATDLDALVGLGDGLTELVFVVGDLPVVVGKLFVEIEDVNETGDVSGGEGMGVLVSDVFVGI